MLKHVVICGPTLVEHDARILKLLNDAITSLEQPVITHVLPERNMGAQAVRMLVNQIVREPLPQSVQSVFITRYEHAVSEFANLVIDGVLKPDEVVFRLVRYIDDGIKVADHYIEGEFVGNSWPMGILW